MHLPPHPPSPRRCWCQFPWTNIPFFRVVPTLLFQLVAPPLPFQSGLALFPSSSPSFQSCRLQPLLFFDFAVQWRPADRHLPGLVRRGPSCHLWRCCRAPNQQPGPTGGAPVWVLYANFCNGEGHGRQTGAWGRTDDEGIFSFTYLIVVQMVWSPCISWELGLFAGLISFWSYTSEN